MRNGFELGLGILIHKFSRLGTFNKIRTNYRINRGFYIKAYSSALSVSITTNKFIAWYMDLTAFDSVIKFSFINWDNIDRIIKRRILSSSMRLVRLLMFKWAFLKPRLEGIKLEILLCWLEIGELKYLWEVSVGVSSCELELNSWIAGGRKPLPDWLGFEGIKKRSIGQNCSTQLF